AVAQNVLQRQGVRIMLTLELFHEREGKYPTRLDELVPRDATQLPTDPWDPQRQLRYRPTNDGFYLLYSVGGDHEDNGGAISPTTQSESLSPYRSGKGFDYVFTSRKSP